jgi:two-component system, chemotaxis family, response regulator WspF
MRIAIVNDMAMAVEALRRVLALAPAHQIIWTALDGVEAVEMCMRDRPDLILMDLTMPRMDGVEATRRIMAQSPCAILIVTSDIEAKAPRVFAAMGQGALDAVDTPLLGSGDLQASARPLLTKIDAVQRLMGEGRGRKDLRADRTSSHRLIVIGASAGGPAALATILEGLPRDFPAGIVIVQHVDARFAPGLVTWLGQHSALPVRLASEGDGAPAGHVLVAGTEEHLVFRSKESLGYAADPSDHVYRPSIDVFFESVARHWRGPVTGVLLTGMGSDGARGLKCLRRLGHHTIAQDQATSAVFGMPKAAARMAAAVEILPIERIPPRLVELTGFPISKKGVAV